jgi:lipoate-protein ligase A
VTERPLPPTRLEVVRSTGPVIDDLAREAWMLERAGSGRCSLLISSWSSPVVVLGYAQPAEDVDLEACRRRGLPVVRRITGGTGVVHDRDLSLSVAVPASHPWAAGIVSLYGRFLDVLEPALRSAGSRVERPQQPRQARRERSPICFEDQTADTLMVDGAKAVGCAQTRRRGGVLIHAAVLCRLDPSLMAAVFGVDSERVRSRLAVALDPDRRDEAGTAFAEGVAMALEMTASEVSPPPVPARFREAYREAKWAPLPPDVMDQHEAENG